MGGDFLRTEEFDTEAVRLAERFGDRATVRFTGANLIWMDIVRGRWDEGLAGAEVFIHECEAGSPHTNEGLVRSMRALVRLGRGDPGGALADLERNVELARENKAPVGIASALAVLAEAHVELGRTETAGACVEEMIPLVREHGMTGAITEIAPHATTLGLRDELAEAVETAPGPRAIRSREVLAFMLDDDLRSAVESPLAEGQIESA
jgi:hypothetical protein